MYWQFLLGCFYVFGQCFSKFCCCSYISKWTLENSTSHKCLNWCETFNLQCKQLWNILGGPVAKNLFSQCTGPGFNPWSGNWIPRTTVKSSHATADPECPWGRKGTGWADCILKKKETPSCTFSELWTTCLVAMGITYLQPNWPPGLINTRFHTKSSPHQKECDNPLCSQSPLSSLWHPLV